MTIYLIGQQNFSKNIRAFGHWFQWIIGNIMDGDIIKIVFLIISSDMYHNQNFFYHDDNRQNSKFGVCKTIMNS